MPGGRPSKFDDLDLEKVKKLVDKGFTNIEMADFFGVVESTWYEWQNAHPEFSEALKDWKASADARVERSLFERAIGYSHPEDDIRTLSLGNNMGSEIVITPTTKHYAPDPTACIFWLKNRQPEKWRDKQEHDLNLKKVSLIDLTGEDAG